MQTTRWVREHELECVLNNEKTTLLTLKHNLQCVCRSFSVTGFVVSRDTFSGIKAAFTGAAVFVLVVEKVLLAVSTRMFVLRCRRFLKPRSPPAARFSPAVCVSKYIKILQRKKLKSVSAVEPSSPPPAPLSPDQLDRIARNKRAALEKLASAQTPPGFGESWRNGLSAEFGKPYFRRVRGPTIIIITLLMLSLLFATVLKAPRLFFFPTVDELRVWGEETPHGVPTCWASLHLDTDVRHPGCKFSSTWDIIVWHPSRFVGRQ